MLHVQKIQKVWILVDLPYGKKAIGTKWVYRNKKDKRGLLSEIKQGFHCLQWECYKAFLYGIDDEDDPRAWHLMKSRFQIEFYGELTSSWITKSNRKTDRWNHYSVSDYAGANLERNIQLKGELSIYWQETYSWQMQKADHCGYSTTEAKFVAAVSYYWASFVVHNQMLEYGVQFHEHEVLHKVIPLFASMLVQPTEDEGAPSERPSKIQPTPSPPHTSEAPKSSGGNHGGHSSSDKSLSGNEGEMTLQRVYDLCISLCTQSMDEECLLEAQIDRKEILKETMDAKRVYTLDYIETEDAQDVGRTRDVVAEKKENAKDVLSTEDALSTTKKRLIQLRQREKEIDEEDESEVESDGIPEAVKKFKQLASDEEMAKKVQEEWEGEEERKRLAVEEATNDGLKGSRRGLKKKKSQWEFQGIQLSDGDTSYLFFDRQDLFHLYDLMREQYSEVTLDGFALILWGDLKIMCPVIMRHVKDRMQPKLS
ncbi:hypothetical protein Tco_0858351 [Tanacetum coccineum]|uniref:Uncharacterized protein n=1 Tax=Tanacetum coccineum TaxID=301880 RepID=A0ABQ5BCY5_9ASTR